MDPCEYIVANGGDAFQGQLDAAQGFFEFRLDMARQEHDTSTLQGRNGAFDDLVHLALCVRDEARRDMVVRWIAQELGVRETKVWAVVDQRALQVRSRRRAAQDEDKPTPAKRMDAEHRLPRELLGLLLTHPEWTGRALEIVDLQELVPCPETKVLNQIAERYARDSNVDTKDLMASLPVGDIAASAAHALAQEKAMRTDQTDEMLHRRLEGYAAFMDRRNYLRAVTKATAGSSSLEDDELLAYYRKRLEKDRKSVQ
jgi:DNA primase